ncbi:MAG TPA: DUF1761 domain-containing protein [Bacteroidia bacterium]|jgi:hypothetical protein
MQPNFLIILLTALVPLVMGFIWYNPKVFGTAWMKAAGVPAENKSANMPLIFGLSFLFSFFLAFAIQFMVIHQWSIFSVLANEPGIADPNSEVGMMVKDFMEKYGTNFRTFKHGALHGVIAGITIVLPVLGTNAMFEGKGAKYILLNVGYWTVCLALMGGILCQFS